MKFYRNYIILILFLTITLLVLQKMEILPSFSDFLSALENKENETKFIVSSIQQMEEASSVYYIDLIEMDTTLSGNSFKGTFNTWLLFQTNLKENFSESSMAITGKKINVSLPFPKLNHSEINLISSIQNYNKEKISYATLNQIALSLSHQNALKKNIISRCQLHIQNIIKEHLQNMGFTEITIDFTQNDD